MREQPMIKTPAPPPGSPPLPNTTDAAVEPGHPVSSGIGSAPHGASHIGAAFDDIGIEPYESLAARLLVAGESGHFTIAVTSAVSGEGVTTVCAGIARALATNTTKSVLLLDANLRRPALHELLDVPIRPGLHELVAGTGVVAFPSSLHNLSVVPCGATTQHPAQLLTSGAAKARIGALRERFDYILVDCPPVLSAAETSSVCRLADGVIIVVRSGLTPREDVERTKDLLGGAAIMGVILNGV